MLIKSVLLPSVSVGVQFQFISTYNFVGANIFQFIGTNNYVSAIITVMNLGVLNIVYMYPWGGIQLSPTTATKILALTDTIHGSISIK